jgi:hypothetical protein
MSDREFENYLTLLAGLLRLSGKQREAIAEELRSHLEDRLEDLMAGGVSREEAVKQALAEFGDAAGLAGQFAAISRNRKRRWLVRLISFSAAATLLIAASLVIFWPGRNAGPGVAAVVAQAPKGVDPFAAPVAGPGPQVADERRERVTPHARVEAELDKPTNVDFVEQPLKDALMYLSDVHQIPIYMRKTKLEEASVPPDKPVTISLRGVPLRTALDLILDELELTYFIKDVLIITTPEDAESNLETRVYDCRDLLTMVAPEVPQARPRAGGTTIPPPPTTAPSTRTTTSDPFAPGPAAPIGNAGEGGVGGAAAPATAPPGGRRVGGMGGPTAGSGQQQPQTELEKRTDQLVELITATVKPDSWDDVGGAGAIDAYNGLFVVSQTAKVHEQVEHVFDMLRKAAGLEAVKGAKVVR